MVRYGVFVMVGVVALAAAGCGPKPEETEPAPAATSEAAEPSAPDHSSGQQHTPPAGGVGATATAQLQPADASSGVTGMVTFTQELGGVRVVADVSGLTPGNHGFHIHQNGECTPPFTSAGDHLNPYSAEHSCPPEQVRHLGDLGSIEIGADGKGHYDQLVDKISLVDPHHQVAGKAVLVHAGADDCKTQPTGGSGDRIACGVITPAHQQPAHQ
jgi:superoxide dismutase, Cu-Zn family